MPPRFSASGEANGARDREDPLEEGNAIGERRRFHAPVLVEAVLDFLDPGPHGGLLLDGTVGGGGHARALLERYPGCTILAVDRDPSALQHARVALAAFEERVRFVHSTFDQVLAHAGVGQEELAGALLDLGVSSHQLDEDDRGFTFRPGAVLDMRMSVAEGGPTAADVLNTADEEELTRIFRDFGELRGARRLAREVVRRRQRERFATSDHLVGALTGILGRSATGSEKARVFQALRIVVNRELDSLRAALPRVRDALRSAGALVVISYHSLEDRIVKTAFRQWSRSCVCPPDLPVCACRGRPLGTTLTRRPVVPGDAEIRENPRARSARLRAWRKAA